MRPLDGLSRPMFPSILDFYSARAERERSPEVDYGYHWRRSNTADHGEPRWRLSYVENTREVYAMRCDGSTAVVLLAENVSRDEVETALTGWAEMSAPTLAYAVERLPARPALAAVDTTLVFEDHTSPLRASNDGRVRVESQRGRHTILVDGDPVWATGIRLVADAFVAGWDANR